MPATLAALVVHDLKNALGALEAELAALADGPGDDAPASGRARQAHRHCRALRERFVAYLSLYGPGGLVAHPDDESPAELLQALADGDDGRRALEVELDTAQAPAFWYFDRRLVRMALEAALHNARRHATSVIRLSAQPGDGGGLLLRIDDDGPGPGGEPAADGDRGAETGLGRPLCEAVARAHHHRGRRGRARLLARPGGGARFELWLP